MPPRLLPLPHLRSTVVGWLPPSQRLLPSRSRRTRLPPGQNHHPSPGHILSPFLPRPEPHVLLFAQTQDAAWSSLPGRHRRHGEGGAPRGRWRRREQHRASSSSGGAPCRRCSGWPVGHAQARLTFASARARLCTSPCIIFQSIVMARFVASVLQTGTWMLIPVNIISAADL